MKIVHIQYSMLEVQGWGVKAEPLFLNFYPCDSIFKRLMRSISWSPQTDKKQSQIVRQVKNITECMNK